MRPHVLLISVSVGLLGSVHQPDMAEVRTEAGDPGEVTLRDGGLTLHMTQCQVSGDLECARCPSGDLEYARCLSR